MNSRWLRNGFIYLLILVAVVAIVYSFFGRSKGTESRPISQVIAEARAGDIQEIVVSGDSLTAKYYNGDVFKSRKEKGSSMQDLIGDPSRNGDLGPALERIADGLAVGDPLQSGT